MTRYHRLASAWASFSGISARDFDAGEARAHDHDRRASRRGRARAERRDMSVESDRRRISIDVKSISREA